MFSRYRTEVLSRYQAEVLSRYQTEVLSRDQIEVAFTPNYLWEWEQYLEPVRYYLLMSPFSDILRVWR